MSKMRDRKIPLLGATILAVVALSAIAGCTARSAVDLPVLPLPQADTLTADSPLPTPTQTAVPVDSTDLGRPPTPTPAVPPFPTPIPTPVVTPIPVAQAPFIPGLEAVERVPTRIFIREGDRIFLLSEDGRSRKLLIDTVAAAGLYLRHYPRSETEGPRLEWGSVSPDGSAVALTVTDVWEYERGQPFSWEWQIFLLDVATSRLSYLVDGRNPVWSPDGRRVAVVGGGGVSAVDVATGETVLLLDLENEEYVSEVAWSPDGSRIACLRTSGLMSGDTSILILDADGTGEPAVVPPRGGYAPAYGLAWLMDSNGLVYARTDYDEAMAFHSHDLWYLNATTLEERRLTSKAAAWWIAASPVRPRWVAFIGEYAFERPEFPPGLGMPLNSIWLVDVERGTTTRLTPPLGSIRALSWSPDGTRLFFQWMAGCELWSLDLATGLWNVVVPTEIDFSVTR